MSSPNPADRITDLELRNENLHLHNEALRRQVASLERRLALANETSRELAGRLRQQRIDGLVAS